MDGHHSIAEEPAAPYSLIVTHPPPLHVNFDDPIISWIRRVLENADEPRHPVHIPILAVITPPSPAAILSVSPELNLAEILRQRENTGKLPNTKLLASARAHGGNKDMTSAPAGVSQIAAPYEATTVVKSGLSREMAAKVSKSDTIHVPETKQISTLKGGEQIKTSEASTQGKAGDHSKKKVIAQHPASGGAPSQKPSRPSWLKSCKHWLKRACRKGDDCEFAHCEVPVKVDFCTYHVRGICNKGSSCEYSHDIPEPVLAAWRVCEKMGTTGMPSSSTIQTTSAAPKPTTSPTSTPAAAIAAIPSGGTAEPGAATTFSRLNVAASNAGRVNAAAQSEGNRMYFYSEPRGVKRETDDDQYEREAVEWGYKKPKY